MRVKLTPAFVAKAKAAPGAERTVFWDAKLPGFGLMVTPAGHKSYVCQYRNKDRQSRRMAIRDVLSLGDARKKARAVLVDAEKGVDTLAEQRKDAASGENTLKSITENWLTREGGKLRTVEERKATFKRLVYPKLGARQIDEIKRSEINKLLDTIEDKNGPRMAALTLAYLRRVMNWHAARSDDFRSPIVRGMGRGVAAKRDRVLTEEEVRAFWRASQGWDHPFSHMLRFILLTATRRDEAADMIRSEVEGGLWTIPAARYKTNIDFELPLSQAARDVLGKVPEIGKKGFVFTTNGDTPIGGFSKFKTTFNELFLAQLQKIAVERGADPAKVALDRWTTHDMRRTARTLMTKAGIEPDHAERALGHVIGGVRGVYDRHAYRDEKAHAFEALAAMIDRIVSPQPNVVPMRRGGDSRAVLNPFGGLA
jgi:integrase